MEKRLEGTEQRLHVAELKLKKFQEENKIMDIEEQARVSIQGAATIKGEIIAIETELKSMKGFATEESNQVVILNQKLAELKKQLIMIEMGQKENNNPGNSENPSHDRNSNFYISFTQAPMLRLQLAQIMREVKTHETVLELLTQQYELAKIAESKTTATIPVLDKALVPEERSKPRRARIVVMSTIITFFISILLAFIFDYFSSMNAEDKKHLQAMKTAVKGSIPFAGKKG